MAGVTRKYDPYTGRDGTVGVDAATSDEDIASRKAAAKLQSTAGADLGGVSARAKVAPKPSEETDPEKMSPLQKASYYAKKRRGATGADAADALARR